MIRVNLLPNKKQVRRRGETGAPDVASNEEASQVVGRRA